MSSDEQITAYLIALLGDKNQEKIVDIIAKVERNEKRCQASRPASLSYCLTSLSQIRTYEVEMF